MRIIKEKDKTEDYLCILWTSSGNQSFFHSLSPAIRNAAGLIMKVEFGGENNNPKVSQGSVLFLCLCVYKIKYYWYIYFIYFMVFFPKSFPFEDINTTR